VVYYSVVRCVTSVFQDRAREYFSLIKTESTSESLLIVSSSLNEHVIRDDVTVQYLRAADVMSLPVSTLKITRSDRPNPPSRFLRD
jgi:hypothetical protein